MKTKNPLWHFYVNTGDCAVRFDGKGKKTAWKTLVTFPEFVECFAMIGRDFPPREELINALNQFTCLLYGDKESATVDDCRYTLFSSGKCLDDVLPPTSDSLQHILRANFQTSWCQCFNAEVIVPPPVGNGLDSRPWRANDCLDDTPFCPAIFA